MSGVNRNTENARCNISSNCAFKCAATDERGGGKNSHSQVPDTRKRNAQASRMLPPKPQSPKRGRTLLLGRVAAHVVVLIDEDDALLHHCHLVLVGGREKGFHGHGSRASSSFFGCAREAQETAPRRPKMRLFPTRNARQVTRAPRGTSLRLCRCWKPLLRCNGREWCSHIAHARPWGGARGNDACRNPGGNASGSVAALALALTRCAIFPHRKLYCWCYVPSEACSVSRALGVRWL